MSLLNFVVVDGFFDDVEEDDDDPDLYDDSNQIGDPANPVWDGSDVHTNPYGTDTTVPDPNEITGD